MSSKTIKLYREDKIKNIKPWIVENIQYETIMGSSAYGVDSVGSDIDLYAFTIPPRRIVFPHTAGHIEGFSRNPERFEVFQKHHIVHNEKEYDVAVYNIVKYFSLLMENNPNIIDSINTRTNSVTHCTKIGQMVRDNRQIFLHKGAWHRFSGYAYSQMKKLQSKTGKGKRKESMEKFGYDVKNAYHIIRLINEVEDILVHGEIDIMRSREMLKSVRRGEWTFDQVHDYFKQKEKILEDAYHTSKLRMYPDEEKIKQLLLDCLEEFYGEIRNEDITQVDNCQRTINQIKELIAKNGL